MRRVLKVIQTVGYLILGLLVVANVWLMAQRFLLHENMPSIFGLTPVYVLSGSMEPAFSAGDMILITEEPEYEIGDVVTYQMGEQTVTHRIIGVEDGLFCLQGDANNAPDIDLVDPSRVLGRQVAVIPYVGWLASFLKTPAGIVLLVGLGVLLTEIPLWLDNRKGDSGDEKRAHRRRRAHRR